MLFVALHRVVAVHTYQAWYKSLTTTAVINTEGHCVTQARAETVVQFDGWVLVSPLAFNRWGLIPLNYNHDYF